MASPILLCTDGSELSLAAIQQGNAVVGDEPPRIVVTVVTFPDDGALVGSGHAGPSMTPAEFESAREQTLRDADDALTKAADVVGTPDSTRVLHGDHPGKAIVDLAAEEGAAAIVVGSRGRGGIKRAVLGSVSDHLVRHAACPVVVIPVEATGA